MWVKYFCQQLILSQLSLILSLSLQRKVATVLCVAGGGTISKQEESASVFGENLDHLDDNWCDDDMAMNTAVQVFAKVRLLD